MFKTAAGQWTCDTCMIQNKSDATKCAACETNKPGAAPPGINELKIYIICRLPTALMNFLFYDMLTSLAMY